MQNIFQKFSLMLNNIIQNYNKNKQKLLKWNEMNPIFHQLYKSITKNNTYDLNELWDNKKFKESFSWMNK